MTLGITRAADRVAIWHEAAEEKKPEPPTSTPPSGVTPPEPSTAAPESVVPQSNKFKYPASALNKILDTAMSPAPPGANFTVPAHEHPVVKEYLDTPSGQSFAKTYLKPQYQDALKSHLGEQNYEKLLHHMPKEHHEKLTTHTQQPAPKSNKFKYPTNTLKKLLDNPKTTPEHLQDWKDKNPGYVKSYLHNPAYQQAIKGDVGAKNYDEWQEHLHPGKEPAAKPLPQAEQPSAVPAKAEPGLGDKLKAVHPGFNAEAWNKVGPETAKQQLQKSITDGNYSQDQKKALQQIYDEHFGQPAAGNTPAVKAKPGADDSEYQAWVKTLGPEYQKVHAEDPAMGYGNYQKFKQEFGAPPDPGPNVAPAVPPVTPTPPAGKPDVGNEPAAESHPGGNEPAIDKPMPEHEQAQAQLLDWKDHGPTPPGAQEATSPAEAEQHQVLSDAIAKIFPSHTLDLDEMNVPEMKAQLEKWKTHLTGTPGLEQHIQQVEDLYDQHFGEGALAAPTPAPSPAQQPAPSVSPHYQQLIDNVVPYSVAGEAIHSPQFKEWFNQGLTPEAQADLGHKPMSVYNQFKKSPNYSEFLKSQQPAPAQPPASSEFNPEAVAKDLANAGLSKMPSSLYAKGPEATQTALKNYQNAVVSDKVKAKLQEILDKHFGQPSAPTVQGPEFNDWWQGLHPHEKHYYEKNPQEAQQDFLAGGKGPVHDQNLKDLAEVMKKPVGGHSYYTDTDDYKAWEKTLTKQQAQDYLNTPDEAKKNFDQFLTTNYPYHEPEEGDEDEIAKIQQEMGGDPWATKPEPAPLADWEQELLEPYPELQPGKPAQVDVPGLTKELSAFFDTPYDDLHQSGKKWKDKTPEEAKADLEELLPIYDDKPELKTLYDKYFGGGTPAGGAKPTDSAFIKWMKDEYGVPLSGVIKIVNESKPGGKYEQHGGIQSYLDEYNKGDYAGAAQPKSTYSDTGDFMEAVTNAFGKSTALAWSGSTPEQHASYLNGVALGGGQNGDAAKILQQEFKDYLGGAGGGHDSAAVADEVKKFIPGLAEHWWTASKEEQAGFLQELLGQGGIHPKTQQGLQAIYDKHFGAGAPAGGGLTEDLIKQYFPSIPADSLESWMQGGDPEAQKAKIEKNMGSSLMNEETKAKWQKVLDQAFGGETPAGGAQAFNAQQFAQDMGKVTGIDPEEILGGTGKKLNDMTPEEAKQSLQETFTDMEQNPSDWSEEEIQAYQGVYDKYFGGGGAAPPPLPEFDWDKFGSEFKGLFTSSSWADSAHTPEEAEAKLKALVDKSNEQHPDSDKTKAANELYTKWFGPVGGGAQPYDADSFFADYKKFFPNTSLTLGNFPDAKTTELGIKDLMEAAGPSGQQKFQQLLDKWFPASGGPTPAGGAGKLTPQQIEQLSTSSYYDVDQHVLNAMTPAQQKYELEDLIKSHKEEGYATATLEGIYNKVFGGGGATSQAVPAHEPEPEEEEGVSAPAKSEQPDPEVLAGLTGANGEEPIKPVNPGDWKDFAAWWGKTQLTPEQEQAIYAAWFPNKNPQAATNWFQQVYDHYSKPSTGDLTAAGMPAWASASWALGNKAEKEWPVFQQWAAKDAGIPKGTSIKQKLGIWNGLNTADKKEIAENYLPATPVDTKAVVGALAGAFPDSDFSKWAKMPQGTLKTNVEMLAKSGYDEAIPVFNQFFGGTIPVPEAAAEKGNKPAAPWRAPDDPAVGAARLGQAPLGRLRRRGQEVHRFQALRRFHRGRGPGRAGLPGSDGQDVATAAHLPAAADHLDAHAAVEGRQRVHRLEGRPAQAH